MERIFTAPISTTITGLLRVFTAYMSRLGSSVCPSCGLSIDGHGKVGTSGFTYVIDSYHPRSSHSRLYVDLTPDGKLSISCGCSQLDDTGSARGSGGTGGTSSFPKN